MAFLLFMRRFTIEVPCTSANIGPGFDVVGLSLSLYLRLTVTVDPSSDVADPQLSYSGEGANDAPLNPYQNLITRVALYVMRVHQIKSFPTGVAIHVENDIPFGRGLGSSGAAVVAGVLLGRELGELHDLSKDRLLDYTLMIERHPDNVAAALMGGFVGSYLLELSGEDAATAQVPLSEVLPEYPADASALWGYNPPTPPHGIGHYIRFGWAKEIKVIAIVPQFEVLTAEARRVLPDTYSKKDLVFNLQRLAVLTTSLTRSPPDVNLIFQAMQDRVHQPYRKHLVRRSSHADPRPAYVCRLTQRASSRPCRPSRTPACWASACRARGRRSSRSPPTISSTSPRPSATSLPRRASSATPSS